MDKDSVILKYMQQEVSDADKDMQELHDNNIQQEKKLESLDSKMDEAYALLKRKRKNVEPIKTKIIQIPEVEDIAVPSYDELFEKAKESLVTRGLDVDSLDYHSLVSQEQLDEIIYELNRPLERREKWIKGDFVAVFIAASIGSLADVILSDRNNKLTGGDSAFSEWLNQFHKHESGGPIDYQGPNFGGGYHRGLSKGHDILRFIEAIMMFKNGQFEGIRFVDGVAHKVVSTVNQYGNPYEQLGWIEAILKYTKHMFADLFSTCSLPFPGSSFLVECSNRNLRKLAANMYQNGFNLKNIMIQSLSTIIVEIILRVYFGIKAIKNYKQEFELSEDYSNFDAIKQFIKPSSKDKLNEMLLMAHSIVTAINIGKVVIKKTPWEINITEIFSVIKYAIKVVNKVIYRNSEYAKLIRNANEIHNRWQELADTICVENVESECMTDLLVIE